MMLRSSSSRSAALLGLRRRSRRGPWPASAAGRRLQHRVADLDRELVPSLRRYQFSAVKVSPGPMSTNRDPASRSVMRSAVSSSRCSRGGRQARRLASTICPRASSRKMASAACSKSPRNRASLSRRPARRGAARSCRAGRRPSASAARLVGDRDDLPLGPHGRPSFRRPALQSSRFRAAQAAADQFERFRFGLVGQHARAEPDRFLAGVAGHPLERRVREDDPQPRARPTLRPPRSSRRPRMR